MGGKCMENNKSRITLSEIISISFKLVSNNALEILKIIGIFMVPVFVLIVLLTTSFIFSMIIGFEPFINMSQVEIQNQIPIISLNMIIPFIGYIIAILIVSFLFYFGYAIIIKLLSDKHLGKDTNWKYSMKYIWQKKWSLIGMNLLVGIVLALVYILIAILFGGVTILTFGVGLIIMIPLILAFVAVVPTMVTLFNSMLVIENLRVMDAIKKTLKIFRKGNFWIIIGRCAIITVLSMVIGLLTSILAIVPIFGFIVILISGVYIQSFVIAASNTIVIEEIQNNNDFSKGNFID